MAINIKFDLLNNPEPPTLVIANRNGNKLGQLDVNAESVELIDKFNEASEISFTVNKYVDGKITNLWDKLVDFRLVYCKEWDCWFEATVELDEATESVKTVFCTQLGQAELSQIMLYDIEINTEDDIARDDYKIGILYDPLDSQCILSRLLDKAPHYSVIHVDNTLWNVQRSFSFDSTSVYDALQEIAEEIGCLFVFNSDSDANGMPQRTISVYDLQQNCLNPKCKYRGEFTDKCPKCNSEDSDGNKYDIEYGYGKDTLIFVTSDELASEGIQLVTDTDAVKNCFKLEAGDDLMTATIRNRNPNGTDYIWYFSDATKEDMPDEMVEKIEKYDKIYNYYYTETDEIPEGLDSSDIKIQKPLTLNSDLVESYNSLVEKYREYYDDESKGKKLKTSPTSVMGFATLMETYYDTIDLGWYLKSGLMPNVKMGETDAEEQGLLLERTLPSLIAVMSLKTVSKATADSSVLMMAKAIVSSHYKVTISSSSLSGSNWSGVFVVENYSAEEDTYTTRTVSRSLVDFDETYIQQKIDKILSKENTDDLSITGVFEKELVANKNSDGEWEFGGEFWDELHKYALVPLTSFRDACQACLDILIEQDVGGKDAEGYIETGEVDDEGNPLFELGDIYNKLYVPYYHKLMAIETEMKVRESELNTVLGVYNSSGQLTKEGLQTNIEDIKIQIQNELNFENYLGRDLWLQFCAYRREDKYSNPNYISDGLNNTELFERALQFYEVAENEIFKSSELQHSISATLNNLLAIPKFKPLVESFEVGNWIRVQVDDYVYKLRLVEYEISYDGFSTISVKFSDVAKTKTGYSDLEDILSNASSMATSYDSIQRQANLGNKARDMIRQWLNEGLDASLIQIQNNTNEDIVIDNNGLIGRSYSDIIEEYSPEQIRLTHNIIAFTDDNWASVKQAIGKHKYKYYDEGKKDFIDTIGYGMNADFCVAGVVAGSQIIGGDIYSDNYSVTNATGSYLNLRDGTFSFGGGSLQFNGDKLIISSNAADTNITELNDEWLKTTTVYAEKLNVNAANVNGKLTAAEIDASKITSGIISADRIDMTGSITWNDMSSDMQLGLTNIQTKADNAVSAANSAVNTISGWTYQGTTYIDGSKLMTGTVMASQLLGGYVGLLDAYQNPVGYLTLGDATSGLYAVQLYSNAAMRIQSLGGNLWLSSSATGYNGSIIQLNYDGSISMAGHVFPSTYGTYSFGSSMLPWANIYSVTAPIVTSDRNNKNSISYEMDKYDKLFDSFKPSYFKMNDGTSNRYHMGFISQDVEGALMEAGLESTDFAGFIKSPVIDEEGNALYRYGLRYSEFIALNTYQIQKLKKRVEELEAKLIDLE